MRKQTASVYFISFVSIKGFKKRSVVKYAKTKNARAKRTKVMFFIGIICKLLRRSCCVVVMLA